MDFSLNSITILKLGVFFVAFVLLQHYLKHKFKTGSTKHRRYRRDAKTSLRYLHQTERSPEHVFAYLRKMNPYVFEELLLLAFSEQGFRVEKSTSYSNDGGVDGYIYDERNRSFLVQAKRYKGMINPQHVKDFSSVVNQRAYAGFFVHSGKTGAASKAKLPRNISIISGRRLLELLDVPGWQNNTKEAVGKKKVVATA